MTARFNVLMFMMMEKNMKRRDSVMKMIKSKKYVT